MRKLNIVHYNINGLGKKKKLLSTFLHKNDIDICCLNEVRTKKHLKFPGYNIIRKNRQNRSGGGVWTLIKSGIQFEENKITTNPRDNEAISIDVFLTNGSKVTVGNIYCPPKKQLNRELLQEISSNNAAAIITGDLNAHCKAFGNRDDNRNGKILWTTTLMSNLFLLNKGMQTYTNPRNGRTDFLDVLLASNGTRQKISNIKPIEDIGSDHTPIRFVFNANPIFNPKEIQRKYKYRQANWGKFRNTLSNSLANLDKPETNMDIDRRIDVVTNLITKAANDSIPKTSGKLRLKPKYPASLLRDINAKNKIRKEWQSTRDADLKREVNWREKQIKKKIKELDNDRLNEDIHRFDPGQISTKDFYKEVRKFERKINQEEDEEIPPLKKDKNAPETYVTNKEKADAMADYLEDIFHLPDDPSFDKETSKRVDTFIKHLKEHPNQGNTVLCREITFGDICRNIKKSRNGKAPGPDGLQMELIRRSPDNLIKELKNIFNAVITNGYYPGSWKRGTMIEIPKKGKPKNLIPSYRPICLTSQLGKILERIIAERLDKYLEDNGLLHRKQSGFRKNKSTVDVVTRLVSCIDKGFNIKRARSNVEPEQTAMLMIDFEKAFDKVWHNGILYKLHLLGMCNRDINLIRSYLTDRTFRVRIGTTLSRVAKITAGVPQGGIISPILFNVFTFDLPDESLTVNKVDSGVFADDGNSWIRAKLNSTLKKGLQYAAIMFESWSRQWRLGINPDKCCIMNFKKRRRGVPYTLPSHDVTLNGKTLVNKHKEKLLGMTLTSDLSWKSHIDELRKRYHYYMNIIRSLKLSRRINSTQAVSLYKTLILSTLEYGQPAWISMVSSIQC